MPSIAANVAPKAEQKPETMYKQLIATTLAHITSIPSIISFLYYFNIAVALLMMFTSFPTIDLFIFGLQMNMTALALVVHHVIHSGKGGISSVSMEKHKLREKLTLTSHLLGLEIKRSAALEERNQQLLQDLNKQKEVIVSKEKGSFNTRCTEYKLTPTEKETLLQVFEIAEDSLQKAHSETAEAVVFKLVEWSAGCYGHDTMQVEFRENAFCFACAP